METNPCGVANDECLWLFGYGSLIYRAGFAWHARRPARIKGYRRRFWQGSQDHRGTPEAPGRVATLVPEAGAVCHGMAYLIERRVLEGLDIREKNGYRRFMTPLYFQDDRDDEQASESASAGGEALVYIATRGNEAWLGPAEAHEIAARISVAEGVSGHNRDYLLLLADALREMTCHDSHVFAIEEALLSLERSRCE